MRALVWTCRLILIVVVLAFAATVCYQTYSGDIPAKLNPAMLALNYVTVIGASLAGLLLPVARRYWQSLGLLLALVAARVLFGGTKPRLAGLERELLTDFQSNLIWIAIGVTGLALIVTITWRAIAGERAVKAIKHAASQPATAVVAPTPTVVEAAPVEEAPKKTKEASKKKSEKSDAAAEEAGAKDEPKAEDKSDSAD